MAQNAIRIEAIVASVSCVRCSMYAACVALRWMDWKPGVKHRGQWTSSEGVMHWSSAVEFHAWLTTPCFKYQTTRIYDRI